MDREEYIQLLERIVKATVNWNKRKIEFDKKFLELQDYTELLIRQQDDVITLTTVFKRTND